MTTTINELDHLPVSMAHGIADPNGGEDASLLPGYKAGYRDAAIRAMEVGNRMVDWIITAKNKAVAVWQVAFAVGLNCCQGTSMTEVAKGLGVTKAAISKGAREFCEQNHLEPSFYMKSEEASKSYRKTREEQL